LQLTIKLMSPRLSAQRQAQVLNLVTRCEFLAVRGRCAISGCVPAGARRDPFRASRKRNGD
jgi:hypothetical protein